MTRLKQAIKLLLILIVFLFLFICYKTTVKKPFCKDCNIILVSLDTLSANHLNCYGYNCNTAPNLCKFAQENIVFKNNFANAHFTLPSHVSIFTGLLPSQHKVNYIYKDYLDKNTPFLPEILQKNGYKTYFYMPTGDSYLPLDKVYNRGIDEIHNGYYPKKNWKAGLETLKENNKKGQKTFLFLHTFWVHSPYFEEISKKMFTNKSYKDIPMSWEEYYSGCSEDFYKHIVKTLEQDLKENVLGLNLYKKIKSMKDIDEFKDFCNNKEHLLMNLFPFYLDRIDKNDPNKVDYLKALYDQEIFTLDSNLKDLLSEVRSDSLKKDTILIITSDHGESFMEHGSLAHNNLYDEILKTPLIMYIPGVKNKEYQHLTQSIDILPTILDLVGIKNNYKFNGKNLFNSNLLGKKTYIIAEDLDQEAKTATIRDLDWKLFVKLNKDKYIPYELYNIKADPREKENVIFRNVKNTENLIFSLNQTLNK